MQPYSSIQPHQASPAIEVLKALKDSNREGDWHLAKQIIDEANCRHRLISSNTLCTPMHIGGGQWIAVSTRFHFFSPGESIHLTGDEPIVIGQPRQQMIASFVEYAFYAVFDDIRYSVGRHFKMNSAIGRFYSTLLDIFKTQIVNCSLETEKANVLLQHIRETAWRIGNGADELAEIAASCQFIRGLLEGQRCLEAA